MNDYKIYYSPLGMTEAVKQGWSWPAFFFSPIWAMFKKMWFIGTLTLIGVLMIYAVFGSPDRLFSFADLLSMAISIIFGFQGNEWRESNLTSRGFRYVRTVTAANPEGALALHVSATQH